MALKGHLRASAALMTAAAVGLILLKDPESGPSTPQEHTSEDASQIVPLSTIEAVRGKLLEQAAPCAVSDAGKDQLLAAKETLQLLEGDLATAYAKKQAEIQKRDEARKDDAPLPVPPKWAELERKKDEELSVRCAPERVDWSMRPGTPVQMVFDGTGVVASLGSIEAIEETMSPAFKVLDRECRLAAAIAMDVYRPKRIETWVYPDSFSRMFILPQTTYEVCLTHKREPLEQKKEGTPELAQPDPPLAQPDQPIAQPDQPIAQPDQPIAQPDPPIAQPDPPLAQPDQPIEETKRPTTPAKKEERAEQENPVESKAPVARPEAAPETGQISPKVASALVKTAAEFEVPLWFLTAIVQQASNFNPELEDHGLGLTQLSGEQYTGLRPPFKEGVQKVIIEKGEPQMDLSSTELGHLFPGTERQFMEKIRVRDADEGRNWVDWVDWNKVYAFTQPEDVFDPEKNLKRFITVFAKPLYKKLSEEDPTTSEGEKWRIIAFHWERGVHQEYNANDASLKDYDSQAEEYRNKLPDEVKKLQEEWEWLKTRGLRLRDAQGNTVISPSLPWKEMIYEGPVPAAWSGSNAISIVLDSHGKIPGLNGQHMDAVETAQLAYALIKTLVDSVNSDNDQRDTQNPFSGRAFRGVYWSMGLHYKKSFFSLSTPLDAFSAIPEETLVELLNRLYRGDLR